MKSIFYQILIYESKNRLKTYSIFMCLVLGFFRLHYNSPIKCILMILQTT